MQWEFNRNILNLLCVLGCWERDMLDQVEGDMESVSRTKAADRQVGREMVEGVVAMSYQVASPPSQLSIFTEESAECTFLPTRKAKPRWSKESGPRLWRRMRQIPLC